MYSNTDKKSIIFVTISMTGGGTEKVITTLANHWVLMGYEISILMIGGSDIAYKLSDKIEVLHLSSATNGNPFARLNRILSLRRAIKQKSNASVIAMGTVASMFTSLSTIGLDNRIIFSERNDPNRLNHRPIRVYEKVIRNILYLRGTVVFQTYMARNLFPKCIKKKSVVIVNPLTENLPKPSDQGGREKTVITAGRLTEQKNHRFLVDAFIAFHNFHSEYVLKIFGRGECEEELKDYILYRHANEYIKLCGFSDKIHDEMNCASIYVSSSDWEGMSNSLMEAMAMGMAVIATNCPVGGNAMLIDDRVNGILIPVGDREKLVDALDEMADLEKIYKYSKEALKVRNDYSLESIAKQWKGIL